MDAAYHDNADYRAQGNVSGTSPRSQIGVRSSGSTARVWS